MIQIHPSASRREVNDGWLHRRPSFSFGDYYDPDNAAFGVMRVCNDDIVAPSKGGGAHSLSDMEIVTLVLRGQIKHEDNLGNAAVISAGQLRRMTAGTGIVHSEYNPSDSEEARYLQLWFMPREKGLAPSHETVSPDGQAMANALLAVVTPDGRGGTAVIRQDVSICLSRIDASGKVYYKQEPGRRIFLFVIEGALAVNDKPMEAGDTARIEFEPELLLATGEGGSAYVMLIDLP